MNYELVGNKVVGGKALKVYKITRNNRSNITFYELRNIYKAFSKNKEDSLHKIMIRGLAPDGMKTLKAFTDDDLKDFDSDDYYKNGVVDKTKFDNYFQIQLYQYQ